MNQDKSNQEINPSIDWIDQLYREHGKFIESVIQYASENSQEAEDIYQEVFMSLLKMKDLSEIKDLRSYLYVLTLNKVNENREKQARSRQILKSYAKMADKSGASQPEHSVLIRYEEVSAVLDKIHTCLTEKESEAVLLRYRDSADNEQAAQKMNVSRSTFLRYVSVGVKKIRDIVRSSQDF